MKSDQPDHIDYRIIEILQQDARTPLKEIARQVFLSSPAVSARIQRLIDAQYITGFHAIVDNKKFGFHIRTPSTRSSAVRTVLSDATSLQVITPCCSKRSFPVRKSWMLSSTSCRSSVKPRRRLYFQQSSSIVVQP